MSFQNSGDSAFNSKRRDGASALSGTSRKQANSKDENSREHASVQPIQIDSPCVCTQRTCIQHEIRNGQIPYTKAVFPRGKPTGVTPVTHGLPSVWSLFPLILTAEAR